MLLGDICHLLARTEKPQLHDCCALVHIYPTFQTPESSCNSAFVKLPCVQASFFLPYLFKALLPEKYYWEGWLELCESNSFGDWVGKFVSSGHKASVCFLSFWEIERCWTKSSSSFHYYMLKIGWAQGLSENASPWTETKHINFHLNKCLIGKAKG